MEDVQDKVTLDEPGKGTRENIVRDQSNSNSISAARDTTLSVAELYALAKNAAAKGEAKPAHPKKGLDASKGETRKQSMERKSLGKDKHISSTSAIKATDTNVSGQNIKSIATKEGSSSERQSRSKTRSTDVKPRDKSRSRNQPARKSEAPQNNESDKLKSTQTNSLSVKENSPKGKEKKNSLSKLLRQKIAKSKQTASLSHEAVKKSLERRKSDRRKSPVKEQKGKVSQLKRAIDTSAYDTDTDTESGVAPAFEISVYADNEITLSFRPSPPASPERKSRSRTREANKPAKPSDVTESPLNKPQRISSRISDAKMKKQAAKLEAESSSTEVETEPETDRTPEARALRTSRKPSKRMLDVMESMKERQKVNKERESQKEKINVREISMAKEKDTKHTKDKVDVKHIQAAPRENARSSSRQRAKTKDEQKDENKETVRDETKKAENIKIDKESKKKKEPDNTKKAGPLKNPVDPCESKNILTEEKKQRRHESIESIKNKDKSREVRKQIPTQPKETPKSGKCSEKATGSSVTSETLVKLEDLKRDSKNRKHKKEQFKETNESSNKGKADALSSKKGSIASIGERYSPRNKSKEDKEVKELSPGKENAASIGERSSPRIKSKEDKEVKELSPGKENAASIGDRSSPRIKSKEDKEVKELSPGKENVGRIPTKRKIETEPLQMSKQNRRSTSNDAFKAKEPDSGDNMVIGEGKTKDAKKPSDVITEQLEYSVKPPNVKVQTMEEKRQSSLERINFQSEYERFMEHQNKTTGMLMSNVGNVERRSTRSRSLTKQKPVQPEPARHKSVEPPKNNEDEEREKMINKVIEAKRLARQSLPPEERFKKTKRALELLKKRKDDEKKGPGQIEPSTSRNLTDPLNLQSDDVTDGRKLLSRSRTGKSRNPEVIQLVSSDDEKSKHSPRPGTSGLALSEVRQETPLTPDHRMAAQHGSPMSTDSGIDIYEAMQFGSPANTPGKELRQHSRERRERDSSKKNSSFRLVYLPLENMENNPENTDTDKTATDKPNVYQFHGSDMEQVIAEDNNENKGQESDNENGSKKPSQPARLFLLQEYKKMYPDLDLNDPSQLLGFIQFMTEWGVKEVQKSPTAKPTEVSDSEAGNKSSAAETQMKRLQDNIENMLDDHNAGSKKDVESGLLSNSLGSDKNTLGNGSVLIFKKIGTIVKLTKK